MRAIVAPESFRVAGGDREFSSKAETRITVTCGEDGHLCGKKISVIIYKVNQFVEPDKLGEYPVFVS